MATFEQRNPFTEEEQDIITPASASTVPVAPAATPMPASTSNVVIPSMAEAAAGVQHQGERKIRIKTPTGDIILRDRDIEPSRLDQLNDTWLQAQGFQSREADEDVFAKMNRPTSLNPVPTAWNYLVKGTPRTVGEMTQLLGGFMGSDELDRWGKDTIEKYDMYLQPDTYKPDPSGKWNGVREWSYKLGAMGGLMTPAIGAALAAGALQQWEAMPALATLPAGALATVASSVMAGTQGAATFYDTALQDNQEVDIALTKAAGFGAGVALLSAIPFEHYINGLQVTRMIGGVAKKVPLVKPGIKSNVLGAFLEMGTEMAEEPLYDLIDKGELTPDVWGRMMEVALPSLTMGFGLSTAGSAYRRLLRNADPSVNAVLNDDNPVVRSAVDKFIRGDMDTEAFFSELQKGGADVDIPLLIENHRSMDIAEGVDRGTFLQEFLPEISNSISKESSLYKSVVAGPANNGITLEQFMEDLYNISRGRIYNNRGEAIVGREERMLLQNTLWSDPNLRNAFDKVARMYESQENSKKRLPYNMYATLYDSLSSYLDTAVNVEDAQKAVTSSIEIFEEALYSLAESQGYGSTIEMLQAESAKGGGLEVMQSLQALESTIRNKPESIRGMDNPEALYVSENPIGPDTASNTSAEEADQKSALLTRGQTFSNFQYSDGDGYTIINLLNRPIGGANPSTVIHEMAHFLVSRMNPDSPLVHIIEREVHYAAFGKKAESTPMVPLREWGLPQHEKFAQLVEEYVLFSRAENEMSVEAFGALKREMKKFLRIANVAKRNSPVSSPSNEMHQAITALLYNSSVADRLPGIGRILKEVNTYLYDFGEPAKIEVVEDPAPIYEYEGSEPGMLPNTAELVEEPLQKGQLDFGFPTQEAPVDANAPQQPEITVGARGKGDKQTRLRFRGQIGTGGTTNRKPKIVVVPGVGRMEHLDGNYEALYNLGTSKLPLPKKDTDLVAQFGQLSLGLQLPSSLYLRRGDIKSFRRALLNEGRTYRNWVVQEGKKLRDIHGSGRVLSTPKIDDTFRARSINDDLRQETGLTEDELLASISEQELQAFKASNNLQGINTPADIEGLQPETQALRDYEDAMTLSRKGSTLDEYKRAGKKTKYFTSHGRRTSINRKSVPVGLDEFFERQDPLYNWERKSMTDVEVRLAAEKILRNKEAARALFKRTHELYEKSMKEGGEAVFALRRDERAAMEVLILNETSRLQAIMNSKRTPAAKKKLLQKYRDTVGMMYGDLKSYYGKMLHDIGAFTTPLQMVAAAETLLQKKKLPPTIVSVLTQITPEVLADLPTETQMKYSKFIKTVTAIANGETKIGDTKIPKRIVQAFTSGKDLSNWKANVIQGLTNLHGLTPEQADRHVNAAIFAAMADSDTSALINGMLFGSMLSNPLGRVLDLQTNAMALTYEFYAKGILEGVSNDVMSVFTGRKNTGLTTRAALQRPTVDSVIKALTKGGQIIKGGVIEEVDHSRIRELGRNAAYHLNMMIKYGSMSEANKARAMALPGNVLMSMDAMTRIVGEDLFLKRWKAQVKHWRTIGTLDAELRSRAEVAARDYVGNGTIDETGFEALVNEIVAEEKNNPGAATSRLLKGPLQEFLDSITYQQKGGKFIQSADAMLGAVDEMVSNITGTSIQLGRVMVLPFFKTNANIISMGLKMTPGAGAVYGKMLGNSVKDIVLQQAIGGVVNMMLGAMMMNGNLTGLAPANKAEREQWDRDGKRPLSLKMSFLGKEFYVPLVGPLAAAIAPAAILIDAAMRAPDEESAIQYTLKSIQATKDYIIGESLFGQAARNLNVTLDKRYAAKMASTFVPYGGFFRWLNGEIQSAKYGGKPITDTKAANFIELFGQSLPLGAIMTNPPIRTTRYGEPILQKRSIDAGGIPLPLEWLPLPLVAGPGARVATSLDQAELVWQKAGWYPSLLSRKYKGPAGVEIELDDKEYGQLLRLYGTILKQQTASFGYSKQFWNAPEKVQQDILSKIEKKARAAARSQLLRSQPSVVQRAVQKRRSLYKMQQGGLE